MKKLLAFTLFNTFFYHVNAQPIPANEAGKYINQVIEVAGYAYYGELLKNSSTPDQSFLLIYLSGTRHSRADFTLIVKINSKDWDNPKIQKLQQKHVLENLVSTSPFDLAASGRIILFEGKPAVEINEDELRILQPLD